MRCIAVSISLSFCVLNSITITDVLTSGAIEVRIKDKLVLFLFYTPYLHTLYGCP